ncbi:MAG: hypothetical protein ABJ308_13275 [Halieaceae bacterium]
MPNLLKFLTLSLVVVLSACKIEVVVPEGGTVATESGSISCRAGDPCIVDASTTDFDETFTAQADEGYEFAGWKDRAAGFYGGSLEPSVRLFTSIFAGNEAAEAFLLNDITFYLEAQFEAQAEEPPEEQAEELCYSAEAINGNDAGTLRLSLSAPADAGQVPVSGTWVELEDGSTIVSPLDGALIVTDGNGSPVHKIALTESGSDSIDAVWATNWHLEFFNGELEQGEARTMQFGFSAEEGAFPFADPVGSGDDYEILVTTYEVESITCPAP